MRGLLRRRPEIDIVTVQDAGLSGIDDPSLLEWAAREGRILLTHDMTTMTHHAYERVRNGLPMLGVFEVGRRISVGDAIEDLILLVDCSLEGEWEGQVRYLPLR